MAAIEQTDSVSKRRIKAALIGNPNCGKTTIFNALTGTHQHVGNYPGVTVESKIGFIRVDGYEIELVDLPGIYSLSAASPEEEVVFNELIGGKIDFIINIVNCTALQRNLYLTTQVSELHLPMLIAFNMSDEADKKQIKFDIPQLENALGYPIVRTVGSRGSGVDGVFKKISEICSDLERHRTPKLNYGGDVNQGITNIETAIAALPNREYPQIPPRFFAIKLLERDPIVKFMPEFSAMNDLVERELAHLSHAHSIDAEVFLSDRRYALISGICRQAITYSADRRREISDVIDVFATNRVIGLPLFLLMIYAVFWFTFTGGDPLMGYIEDGVAALQNWINSVWQEESVLRELIVSGIIGGVGAVVVFLPNIVLMFLALAFLEDSGYMARAAFVVDGILRRFGLHGKSFVPLILGFGCTVPAIMATRTLESERDRKVTIMVLPLMSCGARLPIHLMIIAAFFSRYASWMMFIVYLIGVIIALGAALVMKRTIFAGGGEVFLMELPPYRLPTLYGILLHAWERAILYLKKAGTVILVVSIVLFLMNTYPQKESLNADVQIEKIKTQDLLTDQQVEKLSADPRLVENLEMVKSLQNEKLLTGEHLSAFDNIDTAELDPDTAAALDAARNLADKITYWENEAKAEKLAYTTMGRIGDFIAPIFRPLGFDSKISTAMIGALAAKEVFVAQLGILFSAGEADEASESLRAALVKNYTPLQGFAIMIFCLLSIPCIATLAIIKRELNSWNYAIVESLGLFGLAYIVTLIIYQGGILFNIGTKLVN